MKISEAPQALIDKYSLRAKDYIEAPGKEHWSTEYPIDSAEKALDDLADSKASTVLYFHMPFCPQACYFCLCHFKVTHDYDNIKRALFYIGSELTKMLERERIPNFTEIHFGGGSPTYIREKEFEEFIASARKLAPNPEEVSVEIDPRRVGTDRLHFYADQGVDRLSFGIQEFDREVQQRINRIQPPELIENLLESNVRRRFKSINFDMLIGLPSQTMQTVEKTTKRLIDIAPDRVALSYMHFNPTVHKHQKVMVKDGPLPTFRERKEMHELAVEMLESAGYVRTGMEHFAKPEDDVAKAKREGKAEYNSLGATSGRSTYLFGIGESAYSRIGPYHYTQNFYERDKYENAVSERRLPIWRGHHLTGQDVLRREVIQRLRIDFEIDLEPINKKYCVNTGAMFRRELLLLEVMEQDGLLTLGKFGRDLKCIHLTEFGKNFANVVCRVFDRYMWDGLNVDEFFNGAKVEL